jgi:hypothetical protein
MELQADRRPVNKLAAVVISRGVHYEPTCNTSIDMETYDIAPYPIGRKPPPDIKNILWYKRGWMTIVTFVGGNKNYYNGMCTGGSGRTGGRWLARCVCGKYEIRVGSRFIKKDVFDACIFCRYTKSKSDKKPKIQNKGNSSYKMKRLCLFGI